MFCDRQVFQGVGPALVLCLLVFGAGTAATAQPESKTVSNMVTAEMRENAVQNVERHEWAQQRVEELKAQVEPYMEMSYKQLWMLLPSQDIGRDSLGYRHGRGCPQCYLDHEGEQVGIGRWNYDLLERPWQIQCRRCETWLPKNDFESYYQSALDEQGKFRLGEGDPQFLEPREGVEGEARAWIDDGTGIRMEDWNIDWTGETGRRFDVYQTNAVAHYADRVWRESGNTVKALATLYTLTNDREYARRAAIMLDRLGHVYPDMDETPHSRRGLDTSYAPGRIMGRGHEYGNIRRPYAKAYDYIFDAIKDDSQIIEILSRISDQYQAGDRSSFQAINQHFRDNVLIEMAEDMLEVGGTGRRGRGHIAQAVIAIALDDQALTPTYLDWLFEQEGGQLPATLINHMQRDGFNINVGGGYMRSTGIAMATLARFLRDYEGTEHDLYTDYPMIMNAFTMLSRIRVLDRTMPMIGDGGSSMSMGERNLPLDMLVSGYRTFETEAIAREIDHQYGDLDRAVQMNIYAEDPEAMRESIEAHLEGGPGPFESYSSGGTGLAVLQAPWREDGRAAAINHTRNMSPSHAHADRLSLHLWAFDTVMMPDMGYPMYTGGWPKRHGFTRHTISHNTLMVNDTRHSRSYSGKTRLFADVGPVRVADIDGPGSRDTEGPERWSPNVPYEGIQTYRRGTVMVDVDETDSYLLDLFWARGGENHRLIQNSGASEATHHGLQLVDQEGGTFAGEDVEFGEFYDYDGDRFWGYDGTGFQFLKNVQREQDPSESFWLDWEIDDRGQPDDWQAHMRLHNLTQVDEIALAHGEPSRGRPSLVRYSIRSRLGEDMNSQFISVIEPYMRDPFIQDVAVLKRIENDREPFAAAVEVQLVDGRRDVLLVRKEAGELSVDEFYLNGRFGMARFNADGEVEKLVGIAADEVRAGDHAVTSESGPYRGALAGHDDSDPRNVKLTLRSNQPLSEEVVGKYVIFDNEEIADGSYRIEAVEDDSTVNIGQMQIYERLADSEDFSQGVAYNIKPDESFIIPNTLLWTRESR